METDNNQNDKITIKKEELPLVKKEELSLVEEEEPPLVKKDEIMMLLNALFKHGRWDLPFDIFPDMPTEECQAMIDTELKMAQATAKNSPSIVDWLQSGLFERNVCNVPLALLFIALYEEHPSSDQENAECNFREIYHFLHKLTTNQPVPYLSRNSAKVLRKLLTEVIDEVWPKTQPDLLMYLSKIHIYSRSAVRRTYSRKSMMLNRKTAENCSP